MMTDDNSPIKDGNTPQSSMESAGKETLEETNAASSLPPVRNRVRSVPKKSERTYEVGYAKPPVHSQFKPGQSGNIKGRKRGAKGLKTLARETLTAKITVRTGVGTKRMTRAEALIHKMNEQAMKGNPRLLLAMLAMYNEAIPENAVSEFDQIEQELTPTDEATLAELKNLLLAEARKGA